jgi:hypothetical protein
LKQFDINLEENKYMWNKLILERKQDLIELNKIVKIFLSPNFINNIYDTWIVEQKYLDEIYQISEISGLSVADIININRFFIFGSFCTSAIISTRNQEFIHLRYLDIYYPGIEPYIEKIKDFLLELHFYDKSNKVIFKAVSFVGFIGVLTGINKNCTLSLNCKVNTSPPDKNPTFTKIKKIFTLKKVPCILIREILENDFNYEKTTELLKQTNLSTPCFIIMAYNSYKINKYKYTEPCNIFVISKYFNFYKIISRICHLNLNDYFLVQTNNENCETISSSKNPLLISSNERQNYLEQKLISTFTDNTNIIYPTNNLIYILKNKILFNSTLYTSYNLHVSILSNKMDNQLNGNLYILNLQ